MHALSILKTRMQAPYADAAACDALRGVRYLFWDGIARIVELRVDTTRS